MTVLKNKLKLFLSSILAGTAICIGTIAYLCSENTVVGAVLFSVGLFIVLVNGYALFTGAIAYVTNKKEKNFIDCIIILLGNAMGAFVFGSTIRFTRIAHIAQRAADILTVKTNDSFLSIFILAFFCNMMIFYAVNSYRQNSHDIGKYLGILLCIPVFIICSFEHCVANMCYMAIADIFSTQTFAILIFSILGNTVGGILVCLLTKCAKQ